MNLEDIQRRKAGVVEYNRKTGEKAFNGIKAKIARQKEKNCCEGDLHK